MNYWLRPHLSDAIAGEDMSILLGYRQKLLEQLERAQHLLKFYRENIHKRTGKPYRPSTIKAQEREVRMAEKELEEWQLAVRIMWDILGSPNPKLKGKKIFPLKVVQGNRRKEDSHGLGQGN
ncbi:MAG: hypothetical protein JRJ03_08735 [Deltaproteobacteria bacterium]|nr:hypothetical protein [Deltaproteobacteria bacterium]